MYYVGFYRSRRLVHANTVPSLRYLNIDYFDKKVGLKIFNDTQISCKTTVLILQCLQQLDFCEAVQLALAFFVFGVKSL